HVPGDDRFDLSFRHIWRELDSLIRGAHHGALRRTQTFLAMSRDDGTGTMSLVRGRLRIAWEHAGEQRVFRNLTTRLAELTRAMKGRYVINPFWSRLFGRRLVTVHPLGGCCMADEAGDGVVNRDGQVFTGTTSHDVHDRLYVCDGAIVPLALGTNPALTISALAERMSARAAVAIARDARAAGDRNRPYPQTALPDRVQPTRPGLRYVERLTAEWVRALDQSKQRVELILHISAESIEELINGDAHEATIVGVARDLPRRQ